MVVLTNLSCRKLWYLRTCQVVASVCCHDVAFLALVIFFCPCDAPQVIRYLREALGNAGTNETVQHGACLGLGLAAMSTGGAELYEELKNTLYTDSANAGEAAAYAIGLTMLGKGGSTAESRVALEEMIAYAHETQHEKIIRGLAMGIALTVYRCS